MLYYLFDFLEKNYDLPGAGLFQYISFRSVLAGVLGLFISIFFGKYAIIYLTRKQIGENIRVLGLKGEQSKKGTPTMGGIIIIIGGLLPILLFSKLLNVYVILLITGLIWMGFVGFYDDYIKVFKKNKAGLSGKLKILAQIILGTIIGLTLYFNNNVVIRNFEPTPAREIHINQDKQKTTVIERVFHDSKSLVTTVPFFKNNQLDYSKLLPFLKPNNPFIPILYICIVTFIMTAVSNGANLTDGLDGLAIGVSVIILGTFAILSYISGNFIFAEYLNIMYIPYSSEVVICCMALAGACLGFMWYNTYPAQIFMGDIGSLTLGSFIGILAVIIRKELMLPFLCGIFLIETLSVIIQVFYFKYTRKKYGTGKRVLKMSPLHHHYQKSGFSEPKIVIRFWIVAGLLAVLTIISLKLR